MVDLLSENEYVTSADLCSADLGTGSLSVELNFEASLFYKVLTEQSGFEISDEQERREPSMQTLVRLSRELGVTTDYLLTGTPAEKEREELEKMLLGRIRAADQRLEQRRERPFSREELAVLFAAMLMDA